jgi:hypothetical protein
MKANFSKHKKKVVELPTLKMEDVWNFIEESAKHPDKKTRVLASLTIQKNKKVVSQWIELNKK